MYDSKKIAKIKKWLGSGSINIFGRPFSGKDVQGKRLAELFDGHLIGGGDILRNNTTSEHIKNDMHTGKLIPSEDYGNIVLPYLCQPQLHSKPLILSSVGRWHGEEISVIKALKSSNHPLMAVVNLDITNDESHKRWQALKINNDRSDRHDDTKEILDTRLDEYQDKTVPVISYYNDIGVLITVDGKKTRDEVTWQILDALYKNANN